MKRIIHAMLLSAFLVSLYGCFTAPKVETTKAWEGHYYTTNDFCNGTRSIQLEKDESIWVLSNSTLKRLLKNVGN